MAEQINELDGTVPMESCGPGEGGEDVTGDEGPGGNGVTADEGMTEEPGPSSVLEGGISTAVVSNGRPDEVEMTSLTSSDSVGGATGHGSVSLHAAANLQEPSVVFVVKDVTKTDWQKSRYSYSLSQSSAVVDLYSAIAKEAGRDMWVWSVGCLMCSSYGTSLMRTHFTMCVCIHVCLLVCPPSPRVRGGLISAGLGHV